MKAGMDGMIRNEKRLFNDGWTFAKTGLDETDWASLSFEPVDLPHDWLIYDTLNLYENSIGWYRKVFPWTRDGRRVLLYFEGVYMDSALFVNGRKIGEWKYGYTSFEFDITDALVDGNNEIVVRVVHQSPNSRWYSGAGIYRNVWLKTRGSSFIETDGVYVSVRRRGEEWHVEVDTELVLSREMTVEHIIHRDGFPVAVASERVKPADQGASERVKPADRDAPGAPGAIVNRQTLIVKDPLLWSPDEPNLYRIRTRLAEPVSGEAADVIEQNVGFRDIVMDPARGLIVNGRSMKLNGFCEHHDLGALGAAFNRAAMRRRLAILKDFGCNAIRTAHNPPAPDLMDLADEMGFFVVSEAFDMWERPKTTYDYARFFKEWAAKDVRSWIRRDRNHPSLLMWSIGNEIYDTHAGERGQELTRMLKAWVEEHDPKGNAPVTIGSNYMPWENAQKCADILKVAGYNYAERFYHQHHAEHPDWIIYGSETGSVVQSRGIYHFPYEQPLLADDDEQCSSLGNSCTSWGAKNPEYCLLMERRAPFSLGQFVWTGFDYIGEPTPYHTKNSYFGQFDTASFPKDSAFVYRAGWTDWRTKPFVHVLPHWDFNEGQLVDVRVLSNCPQVELRVNGRSVGTHRPDWSTDPERSHELFGWWKVPYEKGEIRAIGYDEHGNAIAEHVRRSFGDAARIRLSPDKEALIADGTDLIFVEITMEDADGHPVDNATNRVRVEVEGAGRLVGLDNGDSTDYDPYKGKSRRLFGGRLMAVIAATLEPGDIRMTVSSPGLESVTASLRAVPPAKPVSGLSARAANRDLPVVTGREGEIPVRKIELAADGERRLTPDRKTLTVRAVLHPANASYRDVEWRVVNEKGIDTPLAKIEPDGGADGLAARVTALGDGAFRVRCMSRNGTGRVRLISELEVVAEGIGTAFKNPYEFVSAGLYDEACGDIGNGNERGIATGRDGTSYVVYRNLDFGPDGSDTVTLPIFALNDEPHRIQIWEGVPGQEGSELVGDLVYQKPSIWNVYQPETYRLKRKLRGLTTISLAGDRKFHIKGFWFERQPRAFSENRAAECDHLYGDSYRITEEAVEEIGNNVTLAFDGLDFGDEGTDRIDIRGRSAIDRNTIHLRFESPDGNVEQRILEFVKSDGWETRSFSFEPVRGKRKVSFVFLPGSRFDFASFRFGRSGHP